MSVEWFLHKGGTQYGPYTWEQLSAFARDGQVQGEDNIWNSGMAAWAPAREVPGLLPQLPPVNQVPEGAPRPMPGGGGEEVLGIIPNVSKKAGLMKSKTYSLVVTNRQLIFAEVTKKMMYDAVNEANEESKGKGILARMASTATSQQRIQQRYYSMSSQQILAENPDNFAVSNNEVRSVKLSAGHYYDHQSAQKYDDTMLIHTNREKLKLTFQSDNSGEAKKILWRALGKIVK